MQPHRSSWALALGLAFAASGALATPLDRYKAASLSGPYTFQNGYTGDLTLWARQSVVKAEHRLRRQLTWAEVESASRASAAIRPDLLRFDAPIPATPLAFTLQAAAKEKAIELKASKLPAAEQK